MGGTKKTVKPGADRRGPFCKISLIRVRLASVELRGRRIDNLLGAGDPDTKTLATFGAAAREDLTTVLGAHSLPEAVVLDILDVRRLIGSF